ncbi:dUTP diphosphatase [Pseudoalteromonas umbrosa]|uniref:dUTP diphosphatase n=1 Tax=Pseudoalteromonas umbrosa TaxID=3048489 RepID=UPI0024C2242E|nr:hypothetical protein [Pseudoalteromonas sp. B95]MDK1290086.1 hypothetical protein [Pseudoalteromonas sp. B95]
MVIKNEMREQLIAILKEVTWPKNVSLDSAVDAILEAPIASEELRLSLTIGLHDSIMANQTRFAADDNFQVSDLINAMVDAHDVQVAHQDMQDVEHLPAGSLALPAPEAPYFMVGDVPQIQLLNDHAVLPERAHPTDTGLDVTPIRVVKQLRADTWLLGCGFAVAPPMGFYFDLVARSSISKTPVMLANAVGIIDESYRGEVMLAVTLKVAEDLATFEPSKLLGKPLAQLVLRPLIVTPAMQIVESLAQTQRGEGGFGSTDPSASNHSLLGEKGDDVARG